MIFWSDKYWLINTVNSIWCLANKHQGIGEVQVASYSELLPELLKSDDMNQTLHDCLSQTWPLLKE